MKLTNIRTNTLAFYTVLVINLLFTYNSHAIDMRVNHISNSSIYSITLDGDINKGDYDKLLSAIKLEGYLPFLITIQSKGGSVTEAIKIAEFIREALIPVNALNYCYSSCFYIWIASIERGAFDKGISGKNIGIDEFMNSKVIGLHRPYFDKKYFSTLSMAEAQTKQKELENTVRQYLKRMNVHEKWIDEMMMHSSEDIKLVTQRELELEFGFVSHSYEEWLFAKCPINREDLLYGKAEVFTKATGGDDSGIKLSKKQRNEAMQKYLAYFSCKDQAIKESQANTIKKLFQ